MSKRWILKVTGGIAQLRLNRPDKLNALDADMVDDLLIRCKEIERSDARVVILSGEGKAFCAGGDIDAWSGESAETFGRHWVRDGHAAFDALARMRQQARRTGHSPAGGLLSPAAAE